MPFYQRTANFFEVLSNIVDFKLPVLRNINSPEFTNFIDIWYARARIPFPLELTLTY